MSPQNLDHFAGTERFAIRRRLGAGGMGAVYEAFDRDRDQPVALKTIIRLDASSLYRFKREFRGLADVVHPNLVRLYELISDGDRWFFTMELVEGADFLQYVRPEGAVDAHDPLADPSTRSAQLPPDPATEGLLGPLPADPEAPTVTYRGPSPPPTQAEPIPEPSTAIQRPPAPGNGHPKRGALHLERLRSALRQLAEALVALHALGRLHRDIKPSNVLVTRRGRVVVLDFGLATEIMDRQGHTTTDGLIVGTALYMAPEQAAGEPLTPASDWYSVGVMLYRALTGQLPFEGKPLDVLMAKQRRDPTPALELVPEAPVETAELCMELLRRDPGSRPTGAAVLDRLGGPVGPTQASSASRPFVGRLEQLAGLGGAFAEVRRGRAVTAFIHGRSGAGKSALLQRFLDDLAEHGDPVILAGRCYEQESVAYKAVDTLIDALSHYLRRLGRFEAEALLPRDIPALARVFPVLRRVEAVAEAPQRGQEVADPQELRRRAFGALRELLARIGDRRPLVLAIDDLQWGDLDSAALLLELLRPPDPPVLLLLSAYRAEEAESSPCLRRLLGPAEGAIPEADRVEIAVEPLTIAEGSELALKLLGHADRAAESLARLIARESRGSPFFVYELVQYLREGGDLTESMVLAGRITLDDVIWGRIERLPLPARSLLEVLAVAGQPLRQATACRAAGLGPEGFEALGLLRSHHLIRGTGPGSLDDVETYHDRIRETVSDRLPADRRGPWHRRLAEELEASGHPDPETLAVHFEAAGEPARAGTYYARAADGAAAALAFNRAAKLYRRALELRPVEGAEGRALRTKLGDTLANAGRGSEAASAYQEAAVGAGEAEQLELQRRAAYQLMVSGHIDEGLAAIRAILDRMGMPVPSTPRRALFRLLANRAWLRLRGLRFRERAAESIAPSALERIDITRSVAIGLSVADVIRGSDYQTRSLLLALRAGEPLRIALALGWEAVHNSCGGGPARRRTARLIAASEALARRLGHPLAIGTAALSAAAAAYLEGRYRTGLELADHATAIVREGCAGATWELDTTQIFGVWCLVYLGRLGELADRWRDLAKEARARGDRYMEATPGPYVGAIARLAADDVEGARAIAREALGAWSIRGFHIQHLNYYYGSLYTDLYAGQPAAAWGRIVATAPALGASLLLRIQQVRIDVLQNSGRCALAAASGASASEAAQLRRAAEGYARRLERERMAWSDALATLIRAGVAGSAGAKADAERLLAVAAEALDDVDMALFAAAARRRLGLLRGGDEGRSLVARADAWMVGQGIRVPARMASVLVTGFREP